MRRPWQRERFVGPIGLRRAEYRDAEGLCGGEQSFVASPYGQAIHTASREQVDIYKPKPVANQMICGDKGQYLVIIGFGGHR